MTLPVSPARFNVPELLPEQTVASELTAPPTLGVLTVIVTSLEVASEHAPDLMIALYFVFSVRSV